MDDYIIYKEKADQIASQIAKIISKELQLGHKYIHLHITNDDAGMDYVMVAIDAEADQLMIEAKEDYEE